MRQYTFRLALGRDEIMLARLSASMPMSRASASGRQRSCSEQARQRTFSSVGGGVSQEARTRARSMAAASVSARSSASKGTTTRRFVSA